MKLVKTDYDDTSPKSRRLTLQGKGADGNRTLVDVSCEGRLVRNTDAELTETLERGIALLREALRQHKAQT